MNHKPEHSNLKQKTTRTFISSSADETRQLAMEIGKHLKDTTIVRLLGDLGSGKTCFVQGLARGLEVPEGYAITSPTYTLIHEYPGRLSLLHIDLYRIDSEMDAEAIGLPEMIEQGVVAAVEWADRLGDTFWPNLPILDIRFENQEEDIRQLQLFGYGLQISNLIRGVGKILPLK